MDEKELLKEYLEESFSQANNFEQDLIKYEEESRKVLILQSMYRTIHTMKANTGFFAFGNFENLLHKSENILSILQKKDDEYFANEEINEKFLDIFANLSDYMSRSLKSIEESQQELAHEDQALLQNIKDFHQEIDLEKKEKAKGSKKSKLNKLQLKALEKLKGRKSSKTVEAKESKPGQETTAVGIELDDNVIIKLASLNSLTSLSSQLVLARNQLGLFVDQNNEDSELFQHFHKIDLLVHSLSERIAKVRMQPLSVITNKLKRSIKALAKDFNKEVEFETLGTEIEIDRNILESLKDSLVHLFRNALDHGLEGPEERLAFNKNEKGLIRISARYGESNIVLEISDDGRGIDVEKVKAKVLENKLCSNEELNLMSEAEVMEFIFHPGFSTKDAVSKISGRGVGMNIVKESIQKNNGSIEVNSKKNEGTTFTIRLPLTLALGSAVIVEINGTAFCIPSDSVKELLTLDKEQVLSDSKIEIREEFYDIVLANEILSGRDLKLKDKYDAVLIRSEAENYILVVDSIFDLQDIVIKNLPSGAKELDYASGTTILPDGRVSLILDVDRLRKHSEKKILLESEFKIEFDQAKTKSAKSQLVTFWINDFLFGINSDLVSEAVLKKIATPMPNSKVNSLINVRDNVLLSKNLAKQIDSHSSDSASIVNLVLKYQEHSLAIQVDDIEDFIELDDDVELVQDLDPAMCDFVKQAYLLEDGRKLFEIDENFCFNS